MVTQIRVIKQPLGRPPKYRPEYAQQLIEYFEQPAWPSVQPPAEPSGEPVVVTGRFPTLAAFSNMVGVTQQTLRIWADAMDYDDVTPLYPEWKAAYYKAKDYQEQYLLEGYTSGVYANPGFGVLIAKNILRWTDKTEIDSTVKAEVAQTVTHDVVPGLAERFAAFEAKTRGKE